LAGVLLILPAGCSYHAFVVAALTVEDDSSGGGGRANGSGGGGLGIQLLIREPIGPSQPAHVAGISLHRDIRLPLDTRVTVGGLLEAAPNQLNDVTLLAELFRSGQCLQRLAVTLSVRGGRVMPPEKDFLARWLVSCPGANPGPVNPSREIILRAGDSILFWLNPGGAALPANSKLTFNIGGLEFATLQ
jgi:hypothetical protein